MPLSLPEPFRLGAARRPPGGARGDGAEPARRSFAQRRLDTLSGGERQKVYIAAALAQGADIWLLDEPTTFLDYRHQAEILALLASANRESGVTVVAVTHDVNHAVLESDRIVALREGELVFCGTPEGSCARRARADLRRVAAAGRPSRGRGCR